jgi:type IV pilus assembly protein PilA
MKSEFKAKYLQHLVRKNKGNEGFTLIELLVVIIIVGVLAAIALPSFLSQIGKARGSEAKSNLGVINRAQQSYRLENSTFADAYTKLDAQISPKFYDYTTTSGQYTTKTLATAKTANADLKNYGSAVAQSGLDNTIANVLCESIKVAGSAGATDANVTPAGSATVTATAVCADTTKAVEIK